MEVKYEIPVYRLALVKEDIISCCPGMRTKVSSPNDALEVLKDYGLHESAEEHFVMLTLDTQRKITGVFEVSHGTLDQSYVHPRDVFKRAIISNASAIIVAHNHPSGSLFPSESDIEATEKLKKVGSLLGIPILDHLILCPDPDYYFSFLENKMI